MNPLAANFSAFGFKWQEVRRAALKHTLTRRTLAGGAPVFETEPMLMGDLSEHATDALAVSIDITFIMRRGDGALRRFRLLSARN
jgi:hypothetical protein